MWVFSDAGTTVAGEKLYAFTHRTFLEYFAASYIAVASDSPEDLAHALVSRITWDSGQEVFCELAIKIKADSSDRGVDRIYTALLNPKMLARNRDNVLRLLANLLAGTRPSPATVRTLTRITLNYLIRKETFTGLQSPLIPLLTHSNAYKQLICDEMGKWITIVTSSDDMNSRVKALALIAEIRLRPEFNLIGWSEDLIGRYARQIAHEATNSVSLRTAALEANIITLEQALAMPGGLGALIQEDVSTIPYALALATGPLNSAEISKMAAIGWFLAAGQRPPWVRINRRNMPSYIRIMNNKSTKTEETTTLVVFDEFSGLGFAAITAV
jgi:hypothetical protein